jgi:hypothetical protein
MRAILVGFAMLLSSSAFATPMHPASKMLTNALKQGMQIMAQKGDPLKDGKMCTLMKNLIQPGYIAPQLLGQYAQIKTDKAGVKAFTNVMPSVLVTKLMQYQDKAAGITIDVDPNATERSQGIYEVGVTVHAANGNPYYASLIVGHFPAGYRLVDGEYLGFSAVSYLSHDIQKKLAEKYQTDQKTPISDLVKDIKAESGFINCP